MFPLVRKIESILLEYNITIMDTLSSDLQLFLGSNIRTQQLWTGEVANIVGKILKEEPVKQWDLIDAVHSYNGIMQG